MIWQRSSKSMCFVASPMLESLDDVAYFGLDMNDFAIHDPTKDILFSQSISAISSPRSPVATTEKSATPVPLLDQKENNPRYSRDIRSSGLLATFFGSKLNSNYAAKKLKKASKIFLSNEDSHPPATISEPPSPCSHSSDKSTSRQEPDVQHSHQSSPSSAEATDSSRLVSAFKEVSWSVCVVGRCVERLILVINCADADTGFMARIWFFYGNPSATKFFWWHIAPSIAGFFQLPW